LDDIVKANGEDYEFVIRDAIENELTRREELVFKKREKRLSGGDELQHIRDAIRGKSWDAAKNTLLRMTPAGDFLSDWYKREPISDEEAEKYFNRLYKTIHQSGYPDLEGIRESSPYIVNDKRTIKRVSELRKTDVDANRYSLDNSMAYETNNFMMHMGWKDVPPQTMEIYRGVSRADAKLRPGDYVTTNRAMARGYIRGKYGKIIRETVPTDDLIIMKLGDWEFPEFIYYPRSIQNIEDKKIITPMTFREFYEQVNSKTDSRSNWYTKSKISN